MKLRGTPPALPCRIASILGKFPDCAVIEQVASMSKPLASTMLAALVGEERIDWDDRVIDHDADFRPARPKQASASSKHSLPEHNVGYTNQ
jgi:hypothetical protein